MVKELQISQRQAFTAVGLTRSTHHYKPVEKKDSEVITVLKQMVEKLPAIGFWESLEGQITGCFNI